MPFQENDSPLESFLLILDTPFLCQGGQDTKMDNQQIKTIMSNYVSSAVRGFPKVIRSYTSNRCKDYDGDGYIVIPKQVVDLNNKTVLSLSESKLTFYYRFRPGYLHVLKPIEHAFDQVDFIKNIDSIDDIFNAFSSVQKLTVNGVQKGTYQRSTWMKVYLGTLKEISEKHHLPTEITRLLSSYLIK